MARSQIYTMIGPDGKKYKGTRKEITQLMGVDFAIDRILHPIPDRLQMKGWALEKQTKTKRYKDKLKRNTFINTHTKEVIVNRTFNSEVVAAKWDMNRQVIGDVSQGVLLAVKGVMLKCSYDIASQRTTQIDPDIY